MSTAAFCFDLDDTLYDYGEYAEAGLRSAAEFLESQIGAKCREELLTIYFEEDITEETFDQLIDRYDLPSDTVDDLVDAYHSSTGPLDPYPETEPLLAALSTSYRLGLVTDGCGGHAKLDRLGIREYFDAVLVTPTIGRSKHDRAVFERILSDLSVSPEETTYVGDDPRVDFRVPNEMGMTTVRLRRGRYADLEPPDESAAADREIETIGDLILQPSR